MEQTYTLQAPIYIQRPKAGPWSINLNEYRNAHYQTLNNMKKAFKEIMTKQINALPRFMQVRIHYSLFFGSERDVDTNNFCSIVDKFFCDALKELGKIKDDNRKIVTHTSTSFGGVDRSNPRCEVQITGEVMPEEPMKIIYDTPEVQSIVAAYVRNDKDLVTRAILAHLNERNLIPEGHRADIHVLKDETTIRIISTEGEPAIASAPRVSTVVSRTPKLDFNKALVEAAKEAEALQEPVQGDQTSPMTMEQEQPVEATPEPAPEPVEASEPETPVGGLFSGLKKQVEATAPKPGGLFGTKPQSQDQAEGEPATVAATKPLFSNLKG